MATYMHHKILEELVPKWMSDDSAGALFLMDTMQKLNNHELKSPIVNSFAQYFRTDKFDLIDAYVFGQLTCAFITAQLFMTVVTIGHGPLADKNIVGNNELLSNIAPPFNAEFWGGRECDSDGRITWCEPILLHSYLHNEDKELERVYTIIQPESIAKNISGDPISSPNFAPMEVGYCCSGKALGWLNEGHWLCRWPYHSEYAYIYYHPVHALRNGYQIPTVNLEDAKLILRRLPIESPISCLG